jgi:ribosomal protein L37AE/L43A
VGIGAAVGLNAWPDDVGVSHVRRRTEHDCHGCGRPMVEVRSVWVCGLCDRASASQPG